MNIIQHTDMAGEIRTVALIHDDDLAEDVAAKLNSLANGDRISSRDRFRVSKADNCFEGTAPEIVDQIVDRYFW